MCQVGLGYISVVNSIWEVRRVCGQHCRQTIENGGIVTDCGIAFWGWGWHMWSGMCKRSIANAREIVPLNAGT